MRTHGSNAAIGTVRDTVLSAVNAVIPRNIIGIPRSAHAPRSQLRVRGRFLLLLFSRSSLFFFFLFISFLLFPSRYHRDSSRKVRVQKARETTDWKKKLVFPRRIDPRTSQREISERNRTHKHVASPQAHRRSRLLYRGPLRSRSNETSSRDFSSPRIKRSSGHFCRSPIFNKLHAPDQAQLRSASFGFYRESVFSTA